GWAPVDGIRIVRGRKRHASHPILLQSARERAQWGYEIPGCIDPGLAVMFGLNVAVDFFAMERPWGSILMGVTVGVTMLIVLLVWEAVRPTPSKGDSAKSQRSEEDRAKARAERRARLAA